MRVHSKLYGPGQVPLKVIGKFEASLGYKGKHIREDLYVIEGSMRQPLLGKQAIEALNLIKWVGSLDLDSIEKMYPELFGEIGVWKNDVYKITLNESVRLRAISAGTDQVRKIRSNLQD